MKWLLHFLWVGLVSCTTQPPPKPPEAFGPITKANDEVALEELIRAARAGVPRKDRYIAERGQDVHRLMGIWAHQAGIRLEWRATVSLSTTGGIDEPDIRAAVLALALQLKEERGSLLVAFPNKTTISVSDFSNKSELNE